MGRRGESGLKGVEFTGGVGTDLCPTAHVFKVSSKLLEPVSVIEAAKNVDASGVLVIFEALQDNPRLRCAV